MFGEIAVISLLTLYNFTIGLTEGYKWRDSFQENAIVTYKNYHVWRSVTSGAVLAGCFVATDDPVPVALGWIGSTMLYERTISFAEFDDWNKRREPFHIMGIKVKRPPVWMEWTIMGACYAGSAAYLVHKYR